MDLQAELVHAEAGRRVVRVTARREDRCLGSALGEAASAEEAEDRARQRLLERLAAADREPAQITPPAGAATPPASHRVAAPITRLKSAAGTAEGDRRSPGLAATPGAQLPLAQESGSTPAAPFSAAPQPDSAPSRLPAAARPTSAPAAAQPAAPPAASPAAPTAPAAPPPAEAVADTPEEPPIDPDDWSSELLAIERQLQRLGWQRDEEAIYLQRAFGHPSRSRLTSYGDLLAYLRALESLAVPGDPASAAVPLRRQDLLGQCDELLDRLGWLPEQGRRFLEQQLGAASRSQLNDQQLLQFNMLLEGELLTAQR